MINTNWIVITGAPCSGKTALINSLKLEGFNINPDQTRKYIEENLKNGVDKINLRSDKIYFLTETLKKKIINALELPLDKLIFHDYGIPEHLAYAKLFDVDMNDFFINAANIIKYKNVFILEPLDIFIMDDVRTESKEEQLLLDKYISEIYSDLGYNFIRIPCGSLEFRKQQIMNHLKR